MEVKHSKKKEIYIIILVVTFITSVLLFFNVIPNIKKFNQTTLNLFEKLHIKHLKKVNKVNESDLESLEKGVVSANSDVVKAKTLLAYHIDKPNVSELVKSQLSIYTFDRVSEHNSTKYKYTALKPRIEIYKYINLYLLVDIAEDFDENANPVINKIKNEIRKMNVGLKVYLKYLYYERSTLFTGDFYAKIQSLNNKILFEELQDQNVLSIMLLNKSSSINSKDQFQLIEIKELNRNIYTLDIEKELTINSFSYLIYLQKFYNRQKVDFSFSFENFEDYMKNINLLEGREVQFHQFITGMLYNMKKFNQISSNYERIKNMNELSEKYKLLQKRIDEIQASDFNSEKSYESAKEIYVVSEYILNSSEMVVFDHYFSNEFKVGTFLPPLLPIFYGFTTAIKQLFRK